MKEMTEFAYLNEYLKALNQGFSTSALLTFLTLKLLLSFFKALSALSHLRSLS
jgi:hypothetical protein